MGETGRWRNNLINKCLSSLKPVDKVVDDVTIAPVVRQLLQVCMMDIYLIYTIINTSI